MTEEKWVLDTRDGFKIYGILNTTAEKKNMKAILHIHGLGGYAYFGYANTKMALTFPKLGYDVIRVNLYHWQDKARSLVDCTLKIHAADINQVIRHFRKTYKKLYATGHSYGGPSLMESHINQFEAVSLWDPSFNVQKSFSKRNFIKSGKFYVDPAGTGYFLGKPFLDEAEKFTRDHAIKLAKKCKKPLQVIHGADGILIKEGESYHLFSAGKTDYKIIKGTQHCFWEEGSTAPLLRHTRQWFDRF